MDATAITRRLLRDLKGLERDPPFGISAAPKGNNIMLWNAVICGPKETPFEDGTFKLTIEFSEEYPFKPPEVKFVSKMFHPNIFEEDGWIDILGTKWLPVSNVSSILLSIQCLLSDPNPELAANKLAARLFKENQPEYLRKVKECVERSWSDDEIFQINKGRLQQVDTFTNLDGVPPPPPPPPCSPSPLPAGGWPPTEEEVVRYHKMMSKKDQCCLCDFRIWNASAEEGRLCGLLSSMWKHIEECHPEEKGWFDEAFSGFKVV